MQIVRLRHGLLRDRRQSHPRQIPGFLTVPQLTAKLGLERSWIYDRIHNGTIQVTLDPERKLYLFPDTPETLAPVPAAPGGEAQLLAFLGGHQDAVSNDTHVCTHPSPPPPPLTMGKPESL